MSSLPPQHHAQPLQSPSCSWQNNRASHSSAYRWRRSCQHQHQLLRRVIEAAKPIEQLLPATEQLRPVTEAPQAIEALPASEVLRRSRPVRSSEKAIVLPRWPHQKGVPRPVLPARQLLR